MRHNHGLRAQSGGATDASFRDTVLLLSADGTNGAQNNNFVDSSINNASATRAGNVTQGSLSPHWQTWSVSFDGTGDLIDFGSGFTLGTGDFTVECWVYTNEANQKLEIWQNNGLIGGFYLSSNFNSAEAGAILNRASAPGSGWSTLLVGNTVLSRYAWNHVAWVRSSGTIRLYVNGVQDSATLSSSINSSPMGTIGAWNDGNYAHNGYVGDLRVVTGSAIYTSNFTPSKTPLTAVSGTQLLACSSSRFIDKGPNSYSLNPVNQASISKYSPYAPGSAYSASLTGGSAFFDGSGDYISFSDSSNYDIGLSGNPFTWEVWFQLTTLSSSTSLGINRGGGVGGWNGTNGHYWTAFYYQPDQRLYWQFWTGSTFVSIIGSTPCRVSEWTHFAVCYDGTTTRLFKNGIQEASSTAGYSKPSSASITRIGQSAASDPTASSYQSGARLIKGSALYTSNFAVPTAPPTAVANTQLLLNFVNGGIVDATGNSVLETVGNAQVSTTQKKFGTGALYFDGNGDWLTLPMSGDFRLLTFDFTIEGWVNVPVTDSTYRCIFSIGYPVQIYHRNGNVEAYFGSNDGGIYFVNPVSGPASSLAANTWTHFAVTRSGSTFRLFVGGVAGTSVTSSAEVFATASQPSVGTFFPAPSSYLFTGYIDDLRITKGVARYTANFTPPSSAFPLS